MGTSNIEEHILGTDVLKCPGVHDPLTARVAASVGFDAIYMTGWGTSIAKTGYPDVGLATMTEMIDNATKVTQQVDVPVLADADDGYGGPLNVVRTTREYAKTGVAGIHIEDTVGPKGAGAVQSKELLSKEETVAKYRAAVETRDEIGSEMLIIGRTNALVAENGTIDKAIHRANTAADEGVDLVFVFGQSNEKEVKKIAEAVNAPLLYTCGGNHPHLDASTLREYGYDVVIYPTLSTLETIHSVHERMEALEEQGASAVSNLETTISNDRSMNVDKIIGLSEARTRERRYLGDE